MQLCKKGTSIKDQYVITVKYEDGRTFDRFATDRKDLIKKLGIIKQDKRIVDFTFKQLRSE